MERLLCAEWSARKTASGRGADNESVMRQGSTEPVLGVLDRELRSGRPGNPGWESLAWTRMRAGEALSETTDHYHDRRQSGGCEYSKVGDEGSVLVSALYTARWTRYFGLSRAGGSARTVSGYLPPKKD